MPVDTLSNAVAIDVLIDPFTLDGVIRLNNVVDKRDGIISIVSKLIEISSVG